MKDKVSLVWLFLTLVATTVQQSEIPQVTIEALKTDELRVYIPNTEGLKLFAFHANINEEIKQTEPGEFYKETNRRDGDFWVLNFNISLSRGDIIHYWMYVALNKERLLTSDTWKVEELKDFFSPLGSAVCIASATIINGKKVNCSEIVIFEDKFIGPTIDTSKWLVHHKIPTYSGPNFEFNSYLNEDDTRFFKNGNLYIKPIPFINENDVRGVLNLTDKCTSEKLHECIYQHKSSFILPPVKSAKITSKLSFKYGKIEVKAKLPSGDWIVPLIELEDKAQMEGENSPKVWIAYSRGNKVLKGNGLDDLGSRLIFGGPVVYPIEPTRSKLVASKYWRSSLSDDYHIYTFVWKPGKMLFYIDGEIFGDITTDQGFQEYSMDVRSSWSEPEAPYNREYVLSLGVAVGGLYDFPNDYNSENDPKPWDNTERNYILNFFNARNVWLRTWHGDNVALKIDYVRITAV